MPLLQPLATRPGMLPTRVQEIATHFDLRQLPADFLANPYPVYAALRENDPVKRMPDGSYFLTRHADLMTVYRDAATFSSDKKAEFTPKYNQAPFGSDALPAPLLVHHTTSLVFNDPPAHTRVRKLIMGALTRRAIAEMEGSLVNLVDGLLDKIEAQGGGDLIEDFASAIPIEVIGNLLNIPHAERAPLRAWSLAILGALEPKLSPAQEALGNQAVTDFTAYLKTLVAQRRQHPGNPEHDVLTRLIQGETGAEPLSEAELLHNCIFILNAGHETTTNLIGNAIVALQDWPEQLQRLLLNSQLLTHNSAGLEAYLITSVDEFLRFEPSNQLGNRRALRDCHIGGTDLSAGSLITLCIAAANRDPAVFDQPDVLNIERTNNKHLAFGFGIHQCAGLSLARLEGRIAIGRFVRRFPGYRLTGEPVRGGRARFRGFLSVPFACGL
jgi:cytochrome P450